MPAQAAEEMQTRVFRSPPAYTSTPFSLTDPPRDVRDVLERAGIPSPQGASADLYEAALLLVATNTPANLERVQSFIDTHTFHRAPDIAFLVTVLEGPEARIKEADAAAQTAPADAMPQLARLLDEAKDAASGVRVVGDCFLETTAGSRASSESVLTRTSLVTLKPVPVSDTDARSQVKTDSDDDLHEAEELREPGLALYLDPTWNADLKTLEVDFSLKMQPDQAKHEAGKSPTSDEQEVSLTSKFTMASGQTKLVGVTKQGKPGVLRAAFVTAVARHTPQRPPFVPRIVGEDASGLTTAILDHVPTAVLQAPALQKLPLKVWLMSHGVAFGPGTHLSHEDGKLSMTNTMANIVRVNGMVEGALSEVLRTAPLTVETFEAPAGLLRRLARETLGAADDSAMRAAVEAAVERGDARLVDFIFVNAKTSEHNIIRSGRDVGQLTSLTLGAQGRRTLHLHRAETGSHLFSEPTFSTSSGRLELDYFHRMTSGVPETRREPWTDPAAPKDKQGKPGKLEVPLMDVHRLCTTSSTSLAVGGTKLLSLHRPTSAAGAEADKEVLWVTFVHGTMADEAPPAAVPTPQQQAQMEAALPQWGARDFPVPGNFLTRYAPSTDGQPRSLVEILMGHGVPFPKGATVSFDPFAGLLHVRNTNGNLLLMERYLESLLPRPPKRAMLTAQVLQGPGPLLRRVAATAGRQTDHRATLDELLKTGDVQLLDTAHFEVQEDTPAILHPGQQGESKFKELKDISLDKDGAATFIHVDDPPGWKIEVAPVFAVESPLLQLKLKTTLPTAAPEEHSEHFTTPGGLRVEFPLLDQPLSQVEILLYQPDKSVRMVSLWKPRGKPELEKEDVLQVMFITCEVARGVKE